jgi:hypothetical protein
MKLLLDANLSPKVAEGLRQAGFDALHVEDLDLLTATDDEIFDRSVEDQFVMITAVLEPSRLAARNLPLHWSTVSSRLISITSPSTSRRSGGRTTTVNPRPTMPRRQRGRSAGGPPDGRQPTRRGTDQPCWPPATP